MPDPSKAVKIIFLIIIIGSCRSSDLRVKRHIELLDSLNFETRHYIDKGDLSHAEILLDSILNLDSNNFVAYTNRALVKFKKNGSSQEIIADYKKSLQLRPDYDTAIYSLAYYYYLIEDFGNCIYFSNRYIEVNLDKQYIPFFLGTMYEVKGTSELKLKRYEKAFNDLRSAVLVDSTNKEHRKALGNYYFFTSNLNMAIDQFSKAISLDHDYVEALVNRGVCFEHLNSQNSLNLAIADYRAALRLHPDSATKNLILERLQTLTKK